MSVWLAIGSLVAVLGLAAASRWLGLGPAEPLSEAEAEAAVREDRPGAPITSVRVSDDSMSAIVTTDDGTYEVRRHGVGVVVRARARPACPPC